MDKKAFFWFLLYTFFKVETRWEIYQMNLGTWRQRVKEKALFKVSLATFLPFFHGRIVLGNRRKKAWQSFDNQLHFLKNFLLCNLKALTSPNQP